MNENEVVEKILQSAGKHPNSRVSKLIHTVQEQRSHKSIVLLLMEMAEHAEYATDFDISLRYYLDMFSQLDTDSDVVLNEAGLLLLNASKIYAKRVDYVHELVAQQITSICGADKELETCKNGIAEPASSVPKVKRVRKRVLKEPHNPLGVELEPKKFRKLIDEKRFSSNKTNAAKTATILHPLPNADTEHNQHPACWVHTQFVDYENEENTDMPRNYKFFTYHNEHRYNTLVPDINFRLLFKVKDYIDQDDRQLDEELRNGHTLDVASNEDNVAWPALPVEHREKYLRLETHMFYQEGIVEDLRPSNLIEEAGAADSALNTENSRSIDQHRIGDVSQSALDQIVQNSELNDSNILADSAIGDSITENLSNLNSQSCANVPCIANISDCSDTSLQRSALEASTASETETVNKTVDSGIGESMTENNSSVEDNDTINNTTTTECNTSSLEKVLDSSNNEVTAIQQNCNDVSNAPETKTKTTTTEEEQKEESLRSKGDIRVHMSSNDDVGVFLSELNEEDLRMLSPTVVATDVFPALNLDKENLTIIVDDELKTFLNLDDDEEQPETHTRLMPIVINFLKINERFLRRRVLFRLGADFDLLKNTRLLKRKRKVEPQNVSNLRYVKTMKYYSLRNTDMTGVVMTPPPSPGHSAEDDFFGFEDNLAVGSQYKGDRSSTDSGVCDVRTEQSTESINCVKIHPTAIPSSLDTIEEEETAVHDGINSTATAAQAKECDVRTEQSTESINCVEALPSLSEGSQNLIEGPAECSTEEQATTPECDLVAELTANRTKSKVEEWHERLKPILATSRERHHFDVFQLGTEIMDKFNDGSDREYTTFEDVMEDKEPSYVSRYFLSTLLLATQGNIQINIQNRSSEKPSEWSDVHLHLLNTNRHTVSIEDNIGLISSSSSGQPQQKHKTPAKHNPTTTTTDKIMSDVMKHKRLKLGMATSTPNRMLMTPPATPLPNKMPEMDMTASTSKRAQLTMLGKGLPEKGLKLNVATASTPQYILLTPPLSAQLTSIPCNFAENGPGSSSSRTNLNVNISTAKPFKQVEKSLRVNDDDDSGFFSREEQL